VKVNQYLQMEGHQNIFVVGDLTNIDEPKLAFVGHNHAILACSNIKTLASKKSNLKAYSPTKPMMLVSLGRRNGAGYFAGFVVGANLLKLTKSKDFFIGRIWGQMNQKLPK